MTQVEVKLTQPKHITTHFQATQLSSYDLTDDNRMLLTVGTTTYVEGCQVRTTDNARFVIPGRVGMVVDLNYLYSDDKFLIRFPGNVHAAFSPDEIELVSGPDASITTAKYQLTISDIADLQEDMITLLQTLSGRHVSVGYVCIYAYFDNFEQASVAAKAVESTATCETEIREGEFNITSLVK